MNKTLTGTTYATLVTAINSLTDKEFAHSSIRLNNSLITIPDLDNGTQRQYARFGQNGSSAVMYDKLIVDTSKTSAFSFRKNTDGSTSQTDYSVTSWELYYIKNI